MSEEKTQEVEMDEVNEKTLQHTLQSMNGMGMTMGECLFQVIEVNPQEGSFKAVILNRKIEDVELPQLESVKDSNEAAPEVEEPEVVTPEVL